HGVCPPAGPSQAAAGRDGVHPRGDGPVAWMYEIAANAIALIHAVLIGLVVGGALVALTPGVVSRFPRWLIAAYLASVGGTLLSDLILGECILTQWERTLREQALPGSAYGGTFLQHYL